MYLIDSNIIIYSYSEEFQYLREIISGDNVYTSEISKVEVLGYHKIKHNEDIYFRDIFDFLPTLLPDQNIFDRAIKIRKAFNLKLGDSIIAATAMEYDLSIYTRNLSDFERVEGLNCINPIINN